MITFVVTKGNSALDLYAQELARELSCEKIHTDYFGEVSRNSKLLWIANIAKSVKNDWHTVKQFHKHGTILHLPNQHFGPGFHIGAEPGVSRPGHADRVSLF